MFLTVLYKIAIKHKYVQDDPLCVLFLEFKYWKKKCFFHKLCQLKIFDYKQIMKSYKIYHLKFQKISKKM